MILISHRGNTSGPNPKEENSPSYVLEALKQFNVEIDVWLLDDGFYLGHDSPTYKIHHDFLLKEELWCHAKNVEALQAMMNLDVTNYFWHQEDDCTLTSSGYIWTYPGSKLIGNSIAVMPEVSYDKNGIEGCAGICTDFLQPIVKFRTKYEI
jgi:hypothetical protein